MSQHDNRPGHWEQFETAPCGATSAEVATCADQLDSWNLIFRAAVCAAHEALRTSRRDAYERARSVARQADDARDRVKVAIFGAVSIPAAYAALEQAGAQCAQSDVDAACAAIAAEDRRSRIADDRATLKYAPRSDGGRSARIEADNTAYRARRDAEATAARDAERSEKARRVAAGTAAMPSIIATLIGEYVECDGVLLADDGREWVRIETPAYVLEEIGRGTAAAENFRSYIVREAK